MSAARQHLFADIAELKAVLGTGTAATSAGAPGPIDEIAAMFQLTGFERLLLLWCAGTELDSELPPPSFASAFARLPDPDWRAMSPDAALRYWRILEPVGEGGIIGARLRIDERMLLWLLGLPSLDDRLAPLVDRIAPEPGGADIEPLARGFARAWQTHDGSPAIVATEGIEPGAIAAVARVLGLKMLRLRISDLPARADERDSLRRLFEREAVLAKSAMLLTGESGFEQPSALAGFVERLHGFIATTASLPPLARAVVQVRAGRMDYAARLAVWRRSLGPRFSGLNGAVEALADHFHLSEGEIEVAAKALPDDVADEQAKARLWEAGRQAARGNFGELATRVLPKARFEDLVLPEAQLVALRTIAAHVRARARVLHDWGFSKRPSAPLGLVALFAGPSGTGKSMAAEVLAQALDLDLWRIDLASLVSKWVGDTEKNLRRVFDAAERGGSILLFDEADALFGRRSEVRSSHDRFANIEVGYLLQRLERFEGLAILTSNMKDSMDVAFLRRFRFVVSFPLPDRDQRKELWRRAFPEAVPRGALDLDALARLPLAGGSIHAMVLSSAFLAAEDGGPVTMRHLKDAARTEYAKLDRPMAELDDGAWS